MDDRKLFENFTETAGEYVSREQVERLYNRYAWAADYCAGRDVLELACGTGQGLGLLRSRARTLVAGDIRPEFVERARAQYGQRVSISIMDATSLPLASAAFDVVVFFETLYFVRNQAKAISELRRVLRPGGTLLLTSPNPDAPDFHPFPYAHCYHGVDALASYLGRFGFEVEMFGDVPISEVSWKQKAFRPLKRLAVKAGAVPTSKLIKRIIKPILYGRLEKMPAEIDDSTAARRVPIGLATDQPNWTYRVFYCAARVRST